jgi:hypothetical protein
MEKMVDYQFIGQVDTPAGKQGAMLCIDSDRPSEFMMQWWNDAANIAAGCLFNAGPTGTGLKLTPVTLYRTAVNGGLFATRDRLKLLKQAVKLEQQILNVTAQQAFYEALVAEIAAESPEVHRRLITRLRGFAREFNVSRGAATSLHGATSL